MPCTYYMSDENGNQVLRHGITKSGHTTYHCINGLLHREDGPALINKYDNIEVWALNGNTFLCPEEMPTGLFMQYVKWQENKKQKPEKKKKLKYESKLFENGKGKFWRNSKKQLHRIDGPAAIYKNNLGLITEDWCIEGKLHRINGPARIVQYYNYKKNYELDISEEWWYNGIPYHHFTVVPAELENARIAWEENKKNKNT